MRCDLLSQPPDLEEGSTIVEDVEGVDYHVLCDMSDYSKLNPDYEKCFKYHNDYYWISEALEKTCLKTLKDWMYPISWLATRYIDSSLYL